MTDHPVLQAMRAAHAALDAVTVRDAEGRVAGWMSMEGMSPSELRELVRLEAELEGRVAGFRLHAVAAADAGGAADVEATDTRSCAASAGRNRSRSWGGVAGQPARGEVRARPGCPRPGPDQRGARSIIVRAGETVPEGVTARELADCEERLVAKAERMAPDRLRRAARRLLEPLSKRLADEHEGGLLREEERTAERYASMILDDNGDGTWTGRFLVPDLAAHLLKNALEKLSGPRRYSRNRAGQTVEDVTLPGMGSHLSYYEGLGATFIELLEHLPQTGHSRSGITLVVHVDEDRLRAGIGAATLETGVTISVGQARRLACEAGILPMVLGGGSVPLDLGMASGLFSRGQAIALSVEHENCAAEGCDRPFAWCELHHRVPWGAGGPTDLANAAPLCGYHHRRVHDAEFEHQWLPDGSVRFRHRWPSRRSAVDPRDDSHESLRGTAA